MVKDSAIFKGLKGSARVQAQLVPNPEVETDLTGERWFWQRKIYLLKDNPFVSDSFQTERPLKVLGNTLYWAENFFFL